MKNIITKNFIFILLFSTLNPLLVAKEYKNLEYINFYAIAIPKIWKTLRDPVDENCMLVGKNVDYKKSKFTASICVLHLSPKDALRESGFFVIDNNWIKGGSMDSGMAKIEYKKDFTSISGSASCGISDSAGFHAAGGTCFTYLVFGADYSVRIDGNGDINLNNDIQKIIKTLKIKCRLPENIIKEIFSNDH
ncbi:hypothetical protein [Collimonas arenae]|uniref:hypothetical protein n=1 Tax=Collimonas arenae TaxID=279058 RepID=UPI0005711A7D|nr:hypothetical protein [Collimonas arenae]